MQKSLSGKSQLPAALELAKTTKPTFASPGSRRAYRYNAVGSLTTETDPLGNVTTTAYDNLQRRISLTQADPDSGGGLSSPVWTWAYGSNSLVATMTDPLGRDTDYGYDAYGRQTTVTNHEGYVTTTAHNMLDQVTSVTTPDPDGIVGVPRRSRPTPTTYLAPITESLGIVFFSPHLDINGHMCTIRCAEPAEGWAYARLTDGEDLLKIRVRLERCLMFCRCKSCPAGVVPAGSNWRGGGGDEAA